MGRRKGYEKPIYSHSHPSFDLLCFILNSCSAHNTRDEECDRCLRREECKDLFNVLASWEFRQWERAKKIFDWKEKGFTTKQIAEEMHKSTRTIERMMEKYR